MKMKRMVSSLLAAVLISGLVAGCGSSTTSTDSTTSVSTSAADSSAAETPKEKAKLLLWDYLGNGDQQNLLKKLCSDYSAQSQVASVEQKLIPFADFKKQLSVSLASKTLPDVVLIDNPDMASYISMGLFADVTEKLASWPDKDQYFPGPWKSCTLDAKTYGVPFGSNDLALFYNDDMLKKAGVTPPTTWDELRAAAKKLTSKGVYGMAVSAPKNEEGTFQFLPWLLSSGATAEKLDTKAFSMLTDLIKDGSMSKEVINWNQGDVNTQFKAGKVAMMLNGPWQVDNIKKDNPNMKWGVVLVPKDKQYSSVLGGENWGIINSKNVDATVDFVKYAAKPDVLLTYIGKFGYFPSRKDAITDKQFSSDAVTKVFGDELNYAQPRGPHAKWPQISDAISTALQECLTQNKTPEAAVKDAQAKIDAIAK